jgi:hypothetical protein
MNKKEKLIRQYFEIDDINQSETIEVLPLTLVDMLLEYEADFLKSNLDMAKKKHIKNEELSLSLIELNKMSKMSKMNESVIDIVVETERAMRFVWSI